MRRAGVACDSSRPVVRSHWPVCIDGLLIVAGGSSVARNDRFASLCRRFADGSSRTAYIHHYDLAIAAAELQPA